MKEVLFSIGPFQVHGYGLMIAIGVLAAYILTEQRAKRNARYDGDLIFSFMIWAVLGGLLGAKLLYLITQLPAIIENPKLLLKVTDGFVIYGGILGGIFFAYLFCRKKKVSTLAYFDLAIPSVALAQGFGRLGCLLAGCCYGKTTESAFHIMFHESHYAPNNIPLVPTQILSSGLNFVHFIVLMLLTKYKKADGQITGFYLVFYSIGRFILEYLRGDLIRGSVGRFSTSQFISLFLVVAGAALILVSPRLGKKTAAKDAQ